MDGQAYQRSAGLPRMGLPQNGMAQESTVVDGPKAELPEIPEYNEVYKNP